MLDKNLPVANLTTAKTNPAASSANIRQPKSARRPMPMSPPTAAGLAGGGDSVFEAMMAVNQSRNKIFDQVLEGPVSQQTQRQLAQIQAEALKNSLADDIAAGREKPPAQAQALAAAQAESLASGRLPAEAATNPATTASSASDPASAESAAAATVRATKPRRTMGLTAGHTIVSGIDTGRVFSPSQLIAFRQKVGLANVLSATERAAQSLVAGAAQANATAAKSSQNDEITKFIRGGQSLDDAADGVSKSKILERGEKLAKVSGKGTKSARKGGEGSGEDAGALSASLGGANADVDDIINRVADSLGMDPSLIRAVIKTESNFDNKAVSIAGAKGLMQLMPGTAKEMGVKDPFNPLENIWGGARYLKRMLDSYGGNLNKALAAYNWGPGNVNKHGTNGNMPRETRRYIEVVNKNYNRFKKDTSVA